MKGKGIRLEHRFSVVAVDCILVAVPIAKARHERRKHSRIKASHPIAGSVPAIEISDNTDLPRIGRPYQKAVQSGFIHAVAAESGVGLLRLPILKR